jgi:His-Xaa-Ser system radical SAM maturase HxsB
MPLNIAKIDYSKLGYFRFKKLGEKYLLTNEEGGYIFVDQNDFKLFLDDKLDKKSFIYKNLVKKNFIKNEADISLKTEGYAEKKAFLKYGPSLHIMVLTLRCDHGCVYCHASAQGLNDQAKDMDQKTADKALEIAFNTTSPFLAIEFQGGEPLLNWEVFKHTVEKARDQSEKLNKTLELRLVSNLNNLDHEKYDFLIKNKVSICTSLDGPKELHDKNRPNLKKVDNHNNILNWVNIFNQDYVSIKNKGYIWNISSVAVISKNSLSYPREIVDEYIKFGLSSIFVRPINPFGHSKNVWDSVKYSSGDFLKFYAELLSYIIEKNLQGVDFQERLAKIFLEKILTSHDPNMMELRSPCGAGIGQLAYNYNGDVYSCDEGRMMSMMGDENFRLGNVFQNNYEELVASPVVRTLCTASCLESLPGCSECVYAPYCGTCPLYNYATEGNIFSQMPRNERCKIHQGILDLLFNLLQDEKAGEILRNWVK